MTLPIPSAGPFWESIQTGEDTPFFLIEYAFNRAKAAGLEDFDYVPDEHWLAAGEEFPWKLEF